MALPAASRHSTVSSASSTNSLSSVDSSARGAPRAAPPTPPPAPSSSSKALPTPSPAPLALIRGSLDSRPRARRERSPPSPSPSPLSSSSSASSKVSAARLTAPFPTRDNARLGDVPATTERRRVAVQDLNVDVDGTTTTAGQPSSGRRGLPRRPRRLEVDTQRGLEGRQLRCDVAGLWQQLHRAAHAVQEGEL